jgi:hypothetical protein
MIMIAQRQNLLPSICHRTELTCGALLGALALSLVINGGARAADEPPPQISVAVTAKGCDPMELTAPAGLVSFVIVNKSSRAVEWEILDGVMVVDERENIAPGFKSKLTTRLRPGTYQITCGLLDNPRGRLVVTGEPAKGAAARPSAGDLIGVVAEYRVGNQRQLADLAAALHRFGDAERSGDQGGASNAFLEAQTAFLATAPIQGLVAAEAGPLGADFTKLGDALFANPPRRAGDIAGRLEPAATRFATAVAPLVVPADQLIASTVALARGLAQEIGATLVVSPAALARFEAKRAAIDRVVRLFAPYAKPVDPEAVAALVAALDQLHAALLLPSGAAGDAAKEKILSPEQGHTLIASARAVVERVAILPSLLGL